MKTHAELIQANAQLQTQLKEANETIELVKSQLTRALEAIVADETMPLDFDTQPGAQVRHTPGKGTILKSLS